MLEDSYRFSAATVLRDLRVQRDQGLEGQAVRRRRAEFGSNALPSAQKRHPLWQFFDRFRDALVLALLAGALVSLALGRWTDALIILVALLLDATLSFVQVRRTERTLSKLKEFVQPSAVAFRSGLRRKIPARDLVVGDIIEIRAGERVPADARLISVSGLRLQESTLTGEANDIEKSTVPLRKRVPLSNRHNMVYMGTSVVNGSGLAVVIATGTRTEIGKIAQILRTEPSPPSPLQRKLQQTGIMIGTGVLLAVGTLLVAGLFLGQDLVTLLLTATTLIVSAVPEDLTMILTIALTVGVTRILKKRGVVRSLASGETLGAATVICTDKTGTLTRGMMQVEALDFLQGTAIGQGNSRPADLLLNPLYELALIGLVLSSNAQRVTHRNGRVSYAGMATDRAGLAFAEELGFSQARLRRAWQQRGAISFSPQWKYRATLHDHPTQSTRYLFVVGAPEILLEHSSHMLNADAEAVLITSAGRFDVTQQLSNQAGTGRRLVAVAARRNVALEDIQHDDIHDLLYLGLLTINDPVRTEAPAVVRRTLAAGIAVKIVTGDHPETARAIGRGVGLMSDDVITSEDLEHVSDTELHDLVEQTTIFARITPLDKQRIVRALQSRGHVVAMTGDGINDAVALKSADIGVAMGSGTDVAKQAADLVLLDDSFATIVAAVYEGRVLRDNVRKVIAFLLATNSAEVAIFFVSLLAGLPLPLLPAQILWINLVTDGTSDIALSLEPGERAVMQRRPEDPSAPLITSRMLAQIIYAGFVLTVGAMLLYWYLLERTGADLDYARTMVFTFVAFSSLISVWSFRSLKESIIRRGILGNIWVPVSLLVSISLQLFALYLPPLQRIFGTLPLTLRDWGVIIALSLLTLVVVDSGKIFLRILWQHGQSAPANAASASLART
jgi:P-type Ca2+ transporter type 2C